MQSRCHLSALSRSHCAYVVTVMKLHPRLCRCNADKSVRATRASHPHELAGSFFFFFGVAGEEALYEVSVGFAGAKFGVG
jgi:purine nucleoside permease